jgi:hypothetical protein
VQNVAIEEGNAGDQCQGYSYAHDPAG